MTVPAKPKLYHIVHVDRLDSIVAEKQILCDREIQEHPHPGTPIGMSGIKRRRLHELRLTSHTDLFVGDCVPFYFCPRSVMLYLLYRGNHPELAYRGGQEPIIHVEADLHLVVAWADANDRRWAFTLSNAGARFFEDRCDLDRLGEIDWAAVEAMEWSGCIDGKQAEFLLERSFPWSLVERIGVHSQGIYQRVVNAFPKKGHRPRAEIRPDWYY